MKKLFFVLMVFAVTFAVYGQQSSSREARYILFPPNSANLRAVSAQQAIINLEVFTQVARILVDNPQYRLLIDGHANAVTSTSQEETSALRPLSRQRAEVTATFIAEYFDIDRQRIIISGAGGGFPFSSTDGSQNRRVSFFFITP